MLEIPARRVEQTFFEGVARLPAELAANPGRVDRVPPVVSRPIRNERLEGAVVAASGAQPFERGADAVDDLEVRSLVAAADIVLFADAPLLQHEQQTRAVIVDVQPVADVAAGPVNRQGTSVER